MGNVNPLRVSQLNSQLFTLQYVKMQENDLAFFQDYAEFIKKYENEQNKKLLFMAGETFSGKKRSNLIFTESFEEFSKPYRTYPIYDNFYKFSPLQDFLMGVEEPKVYPVITDVELLWFTLYSVTIEPSLGENFLKFKLQKHTHYYVFFQGVMKEMITICIKFDGNHYILDRPLDRTIENTSNGICLYFLNS